MPVERYLHTLVDVTAAQLLQAARTVPIGIIGPATSGTPGTKYTFTDLTTALSTVGAVLYNVASELVGGIEVTQQETE